MQADTTVTLLRIFSSFMDDARDDSLQSTQSARFWPQLFELALIKEEMKVYVNAVIDAR